MRAFSKTVVAWAFYDFANSAFATTVIAVIFNVYFVQVVVGPQGWKLGSLTILGSALWGMMVAVSMAVILVFSPILGAIADCSGSKKKFLAFFWMLGCLSCAGLFFAKEQTVLLAIAAYTLANVGFAAGNAFYNAFLPELASKENLGRVSGFGWAVGYLGGGICLALNLLMIQKPDIFGIPAADHLPVRWSLLVVSFWWFVFGLPLFLFVPEERPQISLRWKEAAGRGYQRFRHTFQKIGHYPELLKGFLAFLVYNDGIETVIVMASVFAATELSMSQEEIIRCFLLIQGVAFLGSLVFGFLADKLSNKRVLFLTLLVWCGIVSWAFFIKTSREFWILGVLVGLVLGGSQSVSRALLGLFTPPQNSAEFFGFFAVAGKFSSVMGPLVYAGFLQHFGSARISILALLLFFVAGMGLLAFVNEPKGLEEGRTAIE